MSKLTHFDAAGAAHMVDVGDKPITRRMARAAGSIFMQAETLKLIEQGAHKKGDVIAVARLAGIMAAKKTADLIPLCHTLPLESVRLAFEIDTQRNAVQCEAVVCCEARTGVEMEALIAVQIALATIYDMCKAVDRGMLMGDIRLLEKSGGRSGEWRRESPP